MSSSVARLDCINPLVDVASMNLTRILATQG